MNTEADSERTREMRREADLLFKGMMQESDRGAALVAASFFEDAIEELLKARFDSRPGKKAALIKPLFDALGPLSTFSGKVKLAYAIDLIEESIANDLETVRRIRNDFSHSFDRKNLDDARIYSSVSSMASFSRSIGDPERDSIATLIREFGSIGDFPGRVKLSLACSHIAGFIHCRIVILRSQQHDVEKEISSLLRGKEPNGVL